MYKTTTILIASALFTLGSTMASAATYGECPSVGSNTGCAILITIGTSGTPTVAQDASQGPYDGSDDTLVGVLNNSTSTVSSLPLSSSTSNPPIFGFESDGMCSSSFGVSGNCSKGLNQGDPYDYSGDFVTFSNIDSTTQNSGTVNFTGGLAPGASTYFSLENNLSASDITAGPPTTGPGGTPGSSVPEPSTYGLMASGIAACGVWLKRRRSITAK